MIHLALHYYLQLKIQSAGTLSPLSKITKSPGTKYIAFITRIPPFLITLAVGAASLLSASKIFQFYILE